MFLFYLRVIIHICPHLVFVPTNAHTHIFMYIYIYILNYITNAPTCFGACAPSSGSFDIVFDKVIKH